MQTPPAPPCIWAGCPKPAYAQTSRDSANRAAFDISAYGEPLINF